MGKVGGRKRNTFPMLPLLAGLLAAGALAACLLLPETVLRAGAHQRFGKVQQADTWYASREVASYTGELDLYRKLLLLSGEWESRTVLVGEGDPWLNQSWGQEADSELDASWWAEWEPRWQAAEMARMRLHESLRYFGTELSVDFSGHWLAEYQVEDSRLGKYRFSYYIYRFPASLTGAGMTAAEGVEEDVLLVLDAETGLILEAEWGPQAVSFFREQDENLFWLWQQLLYANQMVYEELDFSAEEDREGAYQVPLRGGEEIPVRERLVSLQEERPGEVYGWICQVEEDGGARFYAGLPQEE